MSARVGVTAPFIVRAWYRPATPSIHPSAPSIVNITISKTVLDVRHLLV
jgi:hypothetical protein